MSTMPIAVLIPTRDSMALLPAHLETMRPWLDLAEEIVVVDSESSDGTVKYLRERLPPEKTRFFQHPRGLYQSWNFGIQQVNSRYTYISTVGDEMSREGLIHLFEVAEKKACDVVVSPPIFIGERGKPIQPNPWPVHEVISFWNLKNEACVEGILLYAMALSFLPFAVLGSSASNLYRTAALQKNLFPTEFGLNGDGAWGFLNALEVRLAITPRKISFFRVHRKVYRRKDYDTNNPDQRLLDAGLEMLKQALKVRKDLSAQAERLELVNFIKHKTEVQRWREILRRHRKRILPWYLNPFAWQARIHRNHSHDECKRLLKSVLEQVRPA